MVEARELHGQSLDSSAWCGTVFGSVVSPRTLNFDGTTGTSIYGGHCINGCTVSCPGDPCAADAGMSADVGVMADTSIERLERPKSRHRWTTS